MSSIVISRFSGGEGNATGVARLLLLFSRGFKSNKDIKECILQAMPHFNITIANSIEQASRDLIADDESAKEFIATQGLTEREAEAIIWWSADVSIFSALGTDDSPYFVLNVILRKRDAHGIRLWSDYNYYLISALRKIQPREIITYRGESKRVTELSKQYVKGNKVLLYCVM